MNAADGKAKSVISHLWKPQETACPRRGAHFEGLGAGGGAPGSRTLRM